MRDARDGDPVFPRKVEILDLGHFIRARLSQTVLQWPKQSIPLVGYMCWPNDSEARAGLLHTLRSWAKASDATPPIVPARLGRIQHNWLRAADIVHLHWDLAAGQHQKRRGGPSVGKAITLIAANAKSWGTKPASLWKTWSIYRDVGHLVAAAALICEEARIWYRHQPFGSHGLSFSQLSPFQMAMLMPDLVLAVALEFERHSLSSAPHVLTEPMSDPETLWRIPTKINVLPIPPLTRKIRRQSLFSITGALATGAKPSSAGKACTHKS